MLVVAFLDLSVIIVLTPIQISKGESEPVYLATLLKLLAICNTKCCGMISDFFRDSNIVDCHNQGRQHDLALEETWVTTDCYFRLVTTLIGISVTDAWKLADYHGIINFGKQEDNRMSIRRFAGIVGNQLVRRACSIASKTGQRFASDLTQEGIVTAASSFDLSSTVLSSLSSGPEQQIVIPVRSLTDANGDAHHQVLFPLTQSSNGKKYRKT